MIEGCKCLKYNLIRSAKADDILKEYRSINCKTCTRHFGFQNRADNEIYFCSSPCLAVSETTTQQSNGVHVCASLLSAEVPWKIGKTGAAMKNSLGKEEHANVLSEEDREVSNIMKKWGLESHEKNKDEENDHNGNSFTSPTSSVRSNGSKVSRAREGACNTLSRPEASKVAVNTTLAEQLETLTEWRQTIVNPGAKLETEDLPVKSTSTNSLDSEYSSLRGNKGIIDAARKKSTSPPAKSEPKVAILLRPKTAANGKPSEIGKDAAVPKNKASPEKAENVRAECKNPKLWAIGNLMPSSSFVTKAACFVAFPWSPVRFTLNTAADSGRHDELYNEMNIHCGKAKPLERIPSIGEIVFAPYNGEFYRAVVQQVFSETKFIRTCFIDYGDATCVALSDCREPSDEIMKAHPVYGINFECIIKGDCPKEAKLPEKLAAKLQEQVYIEGKPTEGNPFEWKGVLYTDASCTKTFNDDLDKWISLLTSATEPVKVASVKNTANGKIPEAKRDAIKAEKKSEQVLLMRPNPFQPPVKTSVSKRTLRNAKISPNLAHGKHIRVNYMWDYQTLTVSGRGDDDNFTKLDNLIKEHVKTAPPVKRPVEVDDIIIAPYQGSFYRGVITAIDGSNAHVRFLDYGDKTTVPVSELIELSPEIDELPIYGVVMKMMEVPDDPPFVSIADMDTAMETGGQIEVVKRSDETGVWTGFLWLGRDTTWNDMVKEALGANAIS